VYLSHRYLRTRERYLGILKQLSYRLCALKDRLSTFTGIATYSDIFQTLGTLRLGYFKRLFFSYKFWYSLLSKRAHLAAAERLLDPAGVLRKPLEELVHCNFSIIKEAQIQRRA
jgi:hypothetical protein